MLAQSKELLELKELTNGLNEAEQEVYAFFRICPVIMLIIDQGIFVKVSDFTKTSLGWCQEDLVGKSVLDFIHEDDTDEFKKQLELAKTEAEGLQFCTQFLHKNGSYIPLCWHASSPSYNQALYAVACLEGNNNACRQ